MREILFRGKRVDGGEWCYGVPLVEGWSKKTYIASYEYSSLTFIQQIEIIPETVGQFTGLTDKNGKRIFEGDILAYTDMFGNERIEGYVEYGAFNCSCCDGVYGWYMGNGDIRLLDGADMLYIVGNIHDNPELLAD